LSVYFIDTSSIGKRYVAEAGSTWLRNIIRPEHGHTFIISELTLVETVSLLEKKVREGALATIIADFLRFQFLTHAHYEYRVIPIESKILTSSRKLVVKHRSHSLRALDAIQLASAMNARSLITQPITFIASDKRLLDAATGEKFPIDDPRLHP